jgi:Uma2 family endonuclease
VSSAWQKAMTTLIQPANQITQQIALNGVSWQTYQALLNDLGDHRSSRLVYDQEILEIIMPSELHEIINRLLDRIVTALTEELDLKIRAYGSTTLEREDLLRGVEPDSCYYIQSVEQLRAKKLNLQTDPPPDLAIEVDITSSSKRRFGVYQQLQIPEVWRYTRSHGVTIYQFCNGEYQEREFSPTFPMISGAVLLQFLQLSDTEDDNQVIRALRRSLKTQTT